ncbi:MAG: hypothetical protein GY861_17020 [bacterium]|nr:hypothetical protein [bacterium]
MNRQNIKDLIGSAALLVILVFLIHNSLQDAPDCNCPDPEITVMPRVFVNVSDYLPEPYMPETTEIEALYLNSKDNPYHDEPEAIIDLDGVTYEIVDSDMQPLPTYHGDFVPENLTDPDYIVGDGKGGDWELEKGCKPDKEYLFNPLDYVYRDISWFGGSKKGNPADTCGLTTTHLKHWFLSTEHPPNIAGHPQDDYRLLKCWFGCEE